VIFRKELDQRREDCRRLALKVLAARLGRPDGIPPPEIAKGRERILNGNEVVSASAFVKRPENLVEAGGSPTR